jgi:hypothetical protein
MALNNRPTHVAHPEATVDFEGITILGEIPQIAVLIIKRQICDASRQLLRSCDRRRIVMIMGAVRRFEDLQPGAWFYFYRLGAAGVALKVIDKTGTGLLPGPKYIVLDPEVGRLKSSNWSDDMGVYEIPEPTVLPLPAHASYQSENAPFIAGALVFGGETQYLAFVAGDFAGFANLKSGEVQSNPPERPCGWFNNWYLLQRGPNEFEKILAVTAVNPRAPKGAPGRVPDDRGDLGDHNRAATPSVTTKKKSPARVRGESGKRSH